MTYLYEALIKPTRLYIKQCPHCGLKYFGKSSKKELQHYYGSGKYWKRHLKKHKVSPIHLWNSDWYYDTSITKFATKFSNINKIVESIEWANFAIENGTDGGDLGKNVSNKISNKNLKRWNDPNWKNTKGKRAKEKELNTKNDKEWKNTIGKNAVKKRIETISSIEYKNTVGKEIREKISNTKSDPEWKNTVGKEASIKQSKTVNSKEWKEKHYKLCVYCGKGPMAPTNYAKYHGNNCKKKLESL